MLSSIPDASHLGDDIVSEAGVLLCVSYPSLFAQARYFVRVTRPGLVQQIIKRDGPRYLAAGYRSRQKRRQR
jgi:hypothetical protein